MFQTRGCLEFTTHVIYYMVLLTQLLRPPSKEVLVVEWRPGQACLHPGQLLMAGVLVVSSIPNTTRSLLLQDLARDGWSPEHIYVKLPAGEGFRYPDTG